MPFYNGDISQTGLNVDATDVLESVIDEYAALYIIGDLNVRLPNEQMRYITSCIKQVDTTCIQTSCITLSMAMVVLLLISAVSKMSLMSVIRIPVILQQPDMGLCIWIEHCLSSSHDIPFDFKILPRHADNICDHLPIRLQTSYCVIGVSPSNTLLLLLSFVFHDIRVCLRRPLPALDVVLRCAVEANQRALNLNVPHYIVWGSSESQSGE